MDISQHAAPSERVLQELQANFATLAITHEDVLMTGAVGVGTLLEAARGQAMEAELAAAKVPMVSPCGFPLGDRLSFGVMTNNAPPLYPRSP